MAQSKYKWDIDEMNGEINNLKKQKEILEKNKGFLEGLKGEIVAGWRSIAGRMYEDDVEVDLENYQNIIDGLGDRIESLNKIANRYYQNCETEVGKVMSSMAGRVTSI